VCVPRTSGDLPTTYPCPVCACLSMSVLFGRANPKTVTERALGAGGALHACQLTVTESPLCRVCVRPDLLQPQLVQKRKFLYRLINLPKSRWRPSHRYRTVSRTHTNHQRRARRPRASPRGSAETQMSVSANRVGNTRGGEVDLARGVRATYTKAQCETSCSQSSPVPNHAATRSWSHAHIVIAQQLRSSPHL
jgi:hypothetical protein